METNGIYAAIAKGEYTAKDLFKAICNALDEASITRFGEANGYLFTESTECPLAPEHKMRIARVFEEAYRLVATRYKDQAITSAIHHCPTGGTYTIDGVTYTVAIKHGDRPDELHVTLKTSLQQ